MEPKLLFEGIATLDIGGVAHDTYMTAHVETVEDMLVRWYGTVGWIAEPPKKFPYIHIVDGTEILLSDGRKGTIQLSPVANSEGKFEFCGKGLPPGFEPMYTGAVLPSELMPIPSPEYVSAELRSTALPRWRRWLGRLLAVVAFALIVAAVWIPDLRWQYLVTGMITSLVSMIMVTPSRGKALPEAKSDGDS